MWFSVRYHRHRNLEDAILSQAKELSDLKLQLASIYGKIAVKAREDKKVKTPGKVLNDPEIQALLKQVGGEVVAVQDESGKLLDLTEENDG